MSASKSEVREFRNPALPRPQGPQSPHRRAPCRSKQKRLPFFKAGKELRDRISNRLHTTGELSALALPTVAASAVKKY